MSNNKIKCPACNSENTEKTDETKTFDGIIETYYCRDCGAVF